MSSGDELVSFTPAVQLANSESKDQDDMCVWVHPEDRARSTIIASDKSGNRVFVYDLDGKVLQSIPVTKPGNIDLRQRVVLDDAPQDLVVVNQRSDGFKLVIFRVNLESRVLERVDDDCATGQNYGGCLYHSRKNGQLYFVCTSETGKCEQYNLTSNGRKGIKAEKVRTLPIGKCEGAVADDINASLFISEEKKGVWKFDAEPDTSTTGTLIAAVGEHGLKGDVEGLALYKAKDGTGCLLVSDQGRNRYAAYERRAPHQFIGDFSIEGAVQTDGIELCSENLGPRFPEGLFACHTDQTPRPVLLTPWSQIRSKLSLNIVEK